MIFFHFPASLENDLEFMPPDCAHETCSPIAPEDWKLLRSIFEKDEPARGDQGTTGYLQALASSRGSGRLIEPIVTAW